MLSEVLEGLKIIFFHEPTAKICSGHDNESDCDALYVDGTTSYKQMSSTEKEIMSFLNWKFTFDGWMHLVG